MGPNQGLFGLSGDPYGKKVTIPCIQLGVQLGVLHSESHYCTLCSNVFQNAEILEKNESRSIQWISTYIKPGSKRFLSWDKCRGLNFALEVGPFCVVSLVTTLEIMRCYRI